MPGENEQAGEGEKEDVGVAGLDEKEKRGEGDEAVEDDPEGSGGEVLAGAAASEGFDGDDGGLTEEEGSQGSDDEIAGGGEVDPTSENADEEGAEEEDP